MRKLFAYFVLMLNLNAFCQGTPKVTLKNSSQLKLSSLQIKVNITGNFAVTTYDMMFYNGLNRTLEGELTFPLGQGQSVSGFAMDLNGTLREAVVVEKELARVAYETTVRQNIDPALLEKTSGNNYKARVYPILPKAFKRIVLTYEERLSPLSGKLLYELPLGINEIVDNFSLDISVYGNKKKPIIKSNSFKNILFTKKENRANASIIRKNFTPKKPVKVEIENTIGTEKVLTYRDYFYGYIPLKAELRNKKKPNSITILWDISYSVKNRNLDKELELLDMYFSYLKNVQVEFITFNNKITNRNKFLINKGNWDALKKEIQSQTYDGGTNLEIFKALRTKSDEILLFSDGLANLGSVNDFKKKPVYTVNSLTSANHFSLDKVATDSGGLYINLGKLSSQKAYELLKQETLQFLGVKSNNNIDEVYPNRPINVTGDFAITGRFKANTSIKLEFGYKRKVTKTITLNLNDSQNTDLVKRLWAKEKLKSLNREKEENKKQIIALAKQYHLITDYTSMLILDRIEDYIRYRIEPPKELRATYKELLTQRDYNDALERENIKRRKENLFRQYSNILSWYESTFSKEKKKASVQNTRVRNTRTRNNNSTKNTQNNPRREVEIDYSKRVITGTVSDAIGGLPGAFVTIKGTNRGTDTDFDGKFAINAEQNEILIFSYLGYSTKEISIGTSNTINVLLEEDGDVLEEVVIDSYPTTTQNRTQPTKNKKVSTNKDSDKRIVTETNIRGNNRPSQTDPMYIVDGVTTNENPMTSLTSNDIDEVQTLKASDATKIYGARARNGIIIITTKKGKQTNKKQIEELNTKIKEKIELKPWNPKTPYLNILQKESSVLSAYKKYLEIRDTYSNSPMFYIDVADFFDKKNARELAIRVLTNLIEIDLDNYELIKALAYKLEYFEQYDLAKKIYKKVLELRPEEPQSYRDLALAYELAGDYQKSFDLLYKIYNGELLIKDLNRRRYNGIEAIAFVELSRLVSEHRNKLKLNKNQKKLFKEIPVDVRVVVDWNHNDTDIDLWVFDPNEEKAYYRNTKTAIGGRMSKDMTQGYGPEEFMLKDAINGKYKIMINYFADNVQKISGPTILKVTMFTNYGKKDEERKMIIVKLDKKEGYIEVGNLSF